MPFYHSATRFARRASDFYDRNKFAIKTAYRVGKAVKKSFSSKARTSPKRKRVSFKLKRRIRRKGSSNAGMHSSITAEHHKFGNSKKKKLYKSLGTWTYLQQNSGQVAQSAGFQAHADVIQVLDSQAFLGTIAAASDVTNSNIRNNLFDLNPYQNTTGGTVIGVVTPVQDRVHVKTITFEIQLYNATTEELSVFLYFVRNKKVMGINTGGAGAMPTPDNSWADLLLKRNLGQPAAVQATEAGVVYTPGSAGSLSPVHYGTSPAAIAEWRSIWKLLRVRRIEMAAGAGHRLQVTLSVNKTFDRATLSEQYGNAIPTNNYFTIPGTTFSIMMIARGAPAKVETSGAASGINDAIVTPAATEVLYTVTAKYHMTSLGAQRLSYDRIMPQFPSSLTGGAATVQVSNVDTIIATAQV